MTQLLLKRIKKLVADNAQRLGLYHKYLGLLHDSWFIKTNITSDKFFNYAQRLYNSRFFQNVIVDKKKLDIAHDKLVFPIQLDFETTNLTFNTGGQGRKTFKALSRQLSTSIFMSKLSHLTKTK
jgi:hypothetical protein